MQIICLLPARSWGICNSCYRSCAREQGLLCLQLRADEAYGSIHWKMTLYPRLCVKPLITATRAINAFHLSGDCLNSYTFPPFCIIQKVLQTIRKYSATGVILVPYWPTQAWWHVLTNMLVAYPLLLSRKPNTLQLPSDPQLIHPLSKTIRLLLCLLSGDYSRVKAFQNQLQPSYSRHGDVAPHCSTVPTYDDGNSIVVLGKLIPFQQLLIF